MLNGRSLTPGPRPRPPAKMRRQSSLTGEHLKPSRLSFAELTTTREDRALPSRGRGESASASPPLQATPPPAYRAGFELQLQPDSEDATSGGGGLDLGVGRTRSGRGLRIEDTLLGSPIPTTFKLMGNPAIGEMEEWMNEKSKEELAGLLVKADELFKERESDMGLTTKVAKDLKNKHEALLARLPSASPATPDSPNRILSRNHSFTELDSPSPAPPPPLYKHARHGSMSASELSILADQNAELMNKLELLESESTSADRAGRRELGRLEKEISMLRQALEKTQAKSEELEKKTKGLDKGIDKVVEDAWKRRKERERKISALRRSATSSVMGTPRRGGQNSTEDWERPVRNFAPMGSSFGGPSRHFPLSPRDDGEEDWSDGAEADSSFTSNEGGDCVSFPRIIAAPVPIAAPIAQPIPQAQPKPDLDVVAQLLQKVKELEETNARILQQQADTTSKLQAVQRDTEHMTKVYETFSVESPAQVDEFGGVAGNPMDMDMDRDELAMSTGSASKFGSLRRRVDVDRESSRRGKGRRSVHGMVREPSDASSVSSQNFLDFPQAPNSASSSSGFSWLSREREDLRQQQHHRPSYSMGSAINSPGLGMGHGLGSTLNFLDDPLAELSPIGSRLTLESELQGFSSLGEQGWDSDTQKAAWHLRSQSLSNLSLFSVPASPVPGSQAQAPVALVESISASTSSASSKADSKTPVAAEFPRIKVPPRATATPPPPMPGTLPVQPDLNVQPPTPSKSRTFIQAPSSATDALLPAPSSSAPSLHPPSSPGRSPRNETISARIRARKSRWEDERFGSMSSTLSVWGSPPGGSNRALLPLEVGLGLNPVFVPPTLRESGSVSSLRSEGSSVGGMGRGPAPAVRVPMKIAAVVDTLVDQFGGGGLSVPDLGDETSPESDYEDAPDYLVQETGDEATGDEEVAGYDDDQAWGGELMGWGDEGKDGYDNYDGYEEDEEDGFGEEEDDEQTMVNKTPVFGESNALQLHQHERFKFRVSSPKSPGASGASVSGSGSLGIRKKGGVVTGHGGATRAEDQEPVSKKAKPNSAGWGSVLLEVWLWLQFAVIIFVFLFAMAKRGPKAVLKDAERTRTRKQSIRARA